MKKKNQGELDVAKMGMLRWMSRITWKEGIMNEHTKGRVRMREMSVKIQEQLR